MSDSFDLGAEKKKTIYTPHSALLKSICGEIFRFNYKSENKKASLTSCKMKKKWQRWSWNVDYMSNISKSICLTITTLYIRSARLHNRNNKFNITGRHTNLPIFRYTCACMCVCRRKMTGRCERSVRLFVNLCARGAH